MLFNSFEFILVFLPLVLVVYYALGSRFSSRTAIGWLVSASLFFYGWWNPAYLLLLCPSMLINFQLGRMLGSRSSLQGKLLLALGVSFNLGLIGYFKYANFFVSNVNEIFSMAWHLENIVLPLAISFFSFQQIAYLVDAYATQTYEQSLLNYCLFVSFFPQLIAGPIVHHGEMLPQFEKESVFRFDHVKFGKGLTIFQLGLFKKVVFADSVAAYATPVFFAADNGSAVTLFEAWGGVLAYTFQLYFDFSGYSDMAIGIALMFGIYLPLNFNSPYKAVNIIDFWRRWHITLSRFLRDYIYIGLGGNRKGKIRRYINLMVTMLLGGLWHGAGWTFVIWGALHGLYLMINHAWHALRVSLGHDLAQSSRTGRLIGGCLTFTVVVFGWALFRAETFDGAMNIVRGMIGLNGAALDVRLAPQLSMLSDVIRFEGKHAGSFSLWGFPWLVVLGIVVWVLPNVQQIVGYTGVEQKSMPEEYRTPAWAVWHPNLGWAVIMICITFLSIHHMSRISEFLYFQF